MGAPLRAGVRRRHASAVLGVMLLATLLLASACDDTSGLPPPEQQEVTPVVGDAPQPDAELDPIPRTSDANLTITGGGATFPNVLYSRWSDEYQALNPNVRINYQSIGSGGGIRGMIDRTFDYGATDGPMDDEQKQEAGAPIWHIPMAMGAVVPAYNLPGNPELRFSQETIANIFLGNIDRWDHPDIQADNPDLEMPDQDIAVIHRSDGAGTTFIWVDFLASASEQWSEEVGVATSVNWPTGIGANGNEGVANQIRQIPGAIGYVELAYAHQNNMPAAELQNREGEWVAPTFEAVAAAAGGMIEAGEFPDNMEARVVNAPGAEAYPSAGFTWLLLYEDLDEVPGMTLERAQELFRFVLWSLDHDGGQQWNIPLDYAPLHPAVQELARDALKQITYDGEPLRQTMQP